MYQSEIPVIMVGWGGVGGVKLLPRQTFLVKLKIRQVQFSFINHSELLKFEACFSLNTIKMDDVSMACDCTVCGRLRSRPGLSFL